MALWPKERSTMKDYEIKYIIERANDLSREMMLREENRPLSKSDMELCADAHASYGAAILAGDAAQDLDDLTRRIVGNHANETAHDFRTREIVGFGPTDSEFCARALKHYGRELAANLETALAEA